MTEDQLAQPQPPRQEDLLLTITRLLKLERKSMVSKLQPSILRGAKSGKIKTAVAFKIQESRGIRTVQWRTVVRC